MNEFFDLPLARVLGKTAAAKLNSKLGLETAYDLLYYFPRRYHLKGELTSFSQLVPGEEQSVLALISDARVRPTSTGKWMLTLTLTDTVSRMHAVFWAKSENMARWLARRLHPGRTLLFSGKPGIWNGSPQLTHPSYEPLPDEDEDAEEKTQTNASREGKTTTSAGDEETRASSADELASTSISSLNARAQKLAHQPEPIYRAAANLPTWNIAKTVRTVLDMAEHADLVDPLPADVRARHELPGLLAALRGIHCPETEEDYRRARERFAYEEAFTLLSALIRRRDEEKAGAVPVITPQPGLMASRVRAALPFTLTPAQERALETIDTSLASGNPLSALLQADVGSGKTVVALLAMLRAVDAGYQAAFLAPTEILAAQHYRTLTDFCSRVKGDGTGLIGAPVRLLTSSTPTAERRELLARAAAGEPGIFVGTHALLGKDVFFSRLGLAVVDEQHRFGVEQRDRLRRPVGPEQLLPHLLVMSATPIPRTIAMTSFGDLDQITLDSGPRQAANVNTIYVPETNSAWMRRVWQRAADDIAAGGRVFVVCPAIRPGADAGEPAEAGAATRAASAIKAEEERRGAENLPQESPQTLATGENDSPAPPHSVEEITARLSALPQLAGIKIGHVHGQMSPEEKECALAAFARGDKPLLVATVVIEVGIDVRQATTMVILDADRFGLATLHQLRGRVGRDGGAGLCLAVSAAPEGSLGEQRLRAFCAHADGFALARADLELRQAGNLLGTTQSGRKGGFKVLNLARDEEIISRARADAQALLARDPKLSAHPALAWALAHRLSDAELDNLARS